MSPHNHFCAVCFIPVAHCSDDSCREDGAHPNAGEHFCSIHHPDPQYHVEPTPPVGRPIGPVVVKLEKPE